MRTTFTIDRALLERTTELFSKHGYSSASALYRDAIARRVDQLEAAQPIGAFPGECPECRAAFSVKLVGGRAVVTEIQPAPVTDLGYRRLKNRVQSDQARIDAVNLFLDVIERKDTHREIVLSLLENLIRVR